MTNRHNIADELVHSLEQGVAIAQGKMSAGRHWTPPEIDVARIRRRCGLSQQSFAARYGFSVGAVRDWEQKRRRPEKAARTLLLVLDREPEAVGRVLDAVG